jgi:hypothetical protein
MRPRRRPYYCITVSWHAEDLVATAQTSHFLRASVNWPVAVSRARKKCLRVNSRREFCVN